MLAGSFGGQSLRRMVRWHYFSSIEKHVAAGSRTLEFGCGGGNRWLAERYPVTGLEYSFEACRVAQGIYRKSMVADVRSLPLRDQTYECVCSSFVLEHLPQTAAEAALFEIHRILVPGGLFVALLDLECNQPLFRHLKKHHAATYHTALIEIPGHQGLVSEQVWSSRARSAGFQVREWQLMTRFPILDLATYAYFESVPQAAAWLKVVGRAAQWLAHSPAHALYSLGVTAVDDVVRNLLPRSWAYRLLFVLEKAN